MKRTILAIIFLLIPVTIFANYETKHTANTGAPYHAYYNGDHNWPIISGHMGYASYMDKSSMVLLKDNEQGVMFAYNVISIDFNKETPTVIRHGTTWYYKPWNEPDIAYVKYKKNGQWYRFNIGDTYGYNVNRREGFLLGWSVAKGNDYNVGVTQAR